MLFYITNPTIGSTAMISERASQYGREMEDLLLSFADDLHQKIEPSVDEDDIFDLVAIAERLRDNLRIAARGDVQSG